MFNPRPGPEKQGETCTKHPDRPVYELPIGSRDADHAHVNPHGVTFACNATTTKENEGEDADG